MKINFDTSLNEVEIDEANYSQVLNIKQGSNIEDAQIQAWEISNILKNDFKVIKSLLIAPDFSDEFINHTDLEFEISLSLITAGSLTRILEGFKNSKLKQFPYQLLMKDVLIKEERILKAINK